MVLYPIIRLYKVNLFDWSAERRLQWEQRALKAPQERSDEEIEAVPTKKRPLGAEITGIQHVF